MNFWEARKIALSGGVVKMAEYRSNYNEDYFLHTDVIPRHFLDATWEVVTKLSLSERLPTVHPRDIDRENSFTRSKDIGDAYYAGKK